MRWEGEEMLSARGEKTKEGKESAEVKLALAARHWRLQGPGSSAFSGFQVLILSKRSSFDRRSVNLLISR